MTEAKRNSDANKVKSNRTTTSTISSSNSEPNESNNSEIYFYAGAVLVFLVAAKAIVQALSSAFIVLPLLYFYLLSSCPPIASFHAKQELKRVLRGHHLPEQHPDKPSGFWEQTLARVTASVATELATVAGYEVSSVLLAGGAAWFQTIRVGQREFYWVGAAQRWWYLFSREVPPQSSAKSNKRN